MNIQEATEQLWQTTKQQAPPPASLQKTLTFADAYQIQLGVLSRWQAAGENLAAGKIGYRRKGRKMFNLQRRSPAINAGESTFHQWA